MAFDWALPYPANRQPVFARNMVATSQPLATAAGLAALKSGGNAVDAALAAAITLTVVEPNNNGIGSDAFALIYDGNDLHGITARVELQLLRDGGNARWQVLPESWASGTAPCGDGDNLGTPGQKNSASN